jgi:hypothetical protein
MVKVILKVHKSEVDTILSNLVKLGIKNIKIKKKRKSFNLFRYKNTFENTINKSNE